MAWHHDHTRWDDRILALYPHKHLQRQYKKIEKQIKRRFRKYFKNASFSLYSQSKSSDDIKEEFMKLSVKRGSIWFDVNQKEVERAWRKDFRPSLEMARKEFVQHPNCMAFEYNRVCSYYNGSVIFYQGMRFLSLEGPLRQAVRRFFYVLLDHNVSLMVRLSPHMENNTEKCAAYWEGNIEDKRLVIPKDLGKPKSIDYLFTNDWEDNSSTNAEVLLDLVLKAKKLYNPSKGPLAVHCAGGVGRSGTFISAYCLVLEIDEQVAKGILPENIKVSIEKVVSSLAVQRYHMVARAPQYLNLYEVVSLYISKLKENLEA